MRVDIKQVTFIEEGRIIIDGIEYKPLSSHAVLGEVLKIINEMEYTDKEIELNCDYKADYMIGVNDTLNILKRKILSIST